MKDQEYKDALLIAIDDYPKFKPLRKKILKFIIGCWVNGVSTIKPIKVAEIFDIKAKSTVYGHLKALKKDGILTSPDEGEEQFTTFRLNRARADDILAAYSTKKDYLKKI